MQAPAKISVALHFQLAMFPAKKKEEIEALVSKNKSLLAAAQADYDAAKCRYEVAYNLLSEVNFDLLNLESKIEESKTTVNKQAAKATKISEDINQARGQGRNNGRRRR